MKKKPCCDTPAADPVKKLPSSPAAALQQLTSRITQLVLKDPKKAATILQDWINRPADSQSVPRKKAG